MKEVINEDYNGRMSSHVTSITRNTVRDRLINNTVKNKEARTLSCKKRTLHKQMWICYEMCDLVSAT